MTSFGGDNKSIEMPPIYDSNNLNEISLIKKDSESDMNGLVQSLNFKTKKKNSKSKKASRYRDQMYMDNTLKQNFINAQPEYQLVDNQDMKDDKLI